jgi:hypothetical protein
VVVYGDRRAQAIPLVLLLIFVQSVPAQAQALADPPVARAVKVLKGPVLDGVIDDELGLGPRVPDRSLIVKVSRIFDVLN